MDVFEIFKTLSSHMIKGVMIHQTYADYFDFLNLNGYKRLEEYHAKTEMKSYRKLHRYYINRYNRLIPEDQFEKPQIIPGNWYEHTKQDVDINTKRTAVKDAFTTWVSWESETKTLYQQMYKELVEIGEIDTSLKIGELIKDVSQELEDAQTMLINLESIDFSMDCILEEQAVYHDRYKPAKS